MPGSTCPVCLHNVGRTFVATYLPQPFFFHHTPPLSQQQGTDERSKVSPVEETAFCRSHARPSLHASIHRIRHISGGRRSSAGSHYRCRSSAHTPAALMRAVLSDLLAFCVPLNHHQRSVNSQMLLTLLHQVLRSPKKHSNPTDSTAVSHFFYQLTLKFHVPMVSGAQIY